MDEKKRRKSRNFEPWMRRREGREEEEEEKKGR
jgi:hypothetical protein